MMVGSRTNRKLDRNARPRELRLRFFGASGPSDPKRAIRRLEEWRLFQPANLAGVTGISPMRLFPDLNAYAYNYESIVSDLYTLDGAI